MTKKPCFVHRLWAVRDGRQCCKACGETRPLPAWSVENVRGAAVCLATDPNEVPEKHRIRNKRHDPRLSGSQIEREYAKGVERLRDMKRHGALKRGPEECRLAARIPGELFFAKQREDPGYWREGNGIERHKAFQVDN